MKYTIHRYIIVIVLCTTSDFSSFLFHEDKNHSKYESLLSIISVGVHNSLLDCVNIIVDVTGSIVVPEDLSDGWIVDVLHRHRHVCFRRANAGDAGTGGRLLGSDPGQSNS